MSSDLANYKASYSLGLRSQPAEVDATNLDVQGQVPEWLSGRLVRVFPSLFEIGSASLNHWFDGFASLCSLEIAGGQVVFRTAILHSQARALAVQHGHLATSEFGTHPELGILERLAAIVRPPLTDNCNVNIERLGDHYVALTEVAKAIAFDPATLATNGHSALYDGLGLTLATAHPHLARSGELINVGTVFGAQSFSVVFRISPDLRHEKLCSIPVKKPSYLHSFGLTERFVVLCEYPLVVEPVSVLLSGKPFIRNYQWQQNLGTSIKLISRKTGVIEHQFLGKSMFSFHHVNAFERDGMTYVDLLCYENAEVIEALYLKPLRAGTPVPTATLHRLELNLATGTVNDIQLSTTNCELPQINYGRCNELPYRYVWAAHSTTPEKFLDALVKLDLQTCESTFFSEADCYPGEPVFVLSATGTEEDNGVLLSIVLDAVRQRSMLLILDAQSMKELARAYLPIYIPFGFHGKFWFS